MAALHEQQVLTCSSSDMPARLTVAAALRLSVPLVLAAQHAHVGTAA